MRGCVTDYGAGEDPAHLGDFERIWATFEDSAEDEGKGRIKAGGHPASHYCPQYG